MSSLNKCFSFPNNNSLNTFTQLILFKIKYFIDENILQSIIVMKTNKTLTALNNNIMFNQESINSTNSIKNIRLSHIIIIILTITLLLCVVSLAITIPIIWLIRTNIESLSIITTHSLELTTMVTTSTRIITTNEIETTNTSIITQTTQKSNSECLTMYNRHWTYSSLIQTTDLFPKDDLNKDGEPDIILVSNGKITILLNNGDGTFNDAILYVFDKREVLGDFIVTPIDANNDKIKDIIIFRGRNYSILFNNGNGMFRNQIFFQTEIVGKPNIITLSDVNGDNQEDMIITSSYNTTTYTICILFNTANGNFINKMPCLFFESVTSVSAADVNNDEKIDIIVANNKEKSTDIFINSDNEIFTIGNAYSTGHNSLPINVISGDVNGDKMNDIIFVDDQFDVVSVRFNTGNGTFSPKITYSVAQALSVQLQDVSLDDYDGDGKLDIVISWKDHRSVGILLNIGNGTFAPLSTVLIGTEICSKTKTVDLNNDGKFDIIAMNSLVQSDNIHVSIRYCN